LATRSRNLVKGSLLGAEKALFVVPPSENFFIDTKQKLEIAEILADQGK
jgi:CMP-N-acetylneuraminic acid synthetase